jgi:hypothetical protein
MGGRGAGRGRSVARTVRAKIESESRARAIADYAFALARRRIPGPRRPMETCARHRCEHAPPARDMAVYGAQGRPGMVEQRGVRGDRIRAKMGVASIVIPKSKHGTA